VFRSESFCKARSLIWSVKVWALMKEMGGEDKAVETVEEKERMGGCVVGAHQMISFRRMHVTWRRFMHGCA